MEVVAEFDPQTGKPGGRVYGTTWFTVFSPRIDNYTIGITPAEKWTATPTAPGTAVVGWVGGPRSGRASLVRRRYRYHVDPQAVADGMESVPVQVWSTKSFTANWAADMDPNAPVVMVPAAISREPYQSAATAASPPMNSIRGGSADTTLVTRRLVR